MIDAILAADSRLATYGTLGPGRPNAHQLDGLAGSWAKGVVRGRLVDAGWGSSLGFPALVLDERGGSIDVDVFTSTELPKHWNRLDAFEGAEYRRLVAPVEIDGVSALACIYVHVD